jgi:hypothetical protein
MYGLLDERECKSSRACRRARTIVPMGRGQRTTPSSMSAMPSDGRASDTSRQLRGEAQQVSDALVAQGADAVALFGSVARGDANGGSDIDLFVVADKPLRARELALPETTAELGISYAAWDWLTEPTGRQWDFYRLIASETQMLHDPDGHLARTLNDLPQPPAEELDRQFDVMQAKLKPCTKLKRFGGLYQFVLESSYRWSKTAVMLANARARQITTCRADAFSAFAARHPDRAQDLAWIEHIEPHYLRTMGKLPDDAKMPFPAQGCDEQAQRSLDAAARIIDTARAEHAA